MIRPARFARIAVLVAVLVATPAARALTATAPPDTTVEGFVRAMADSTDRWFGLSAQAGDTTGLDSLRTYFLAHPNAPRTRARRISLAPIASFNRVLGLAPGALVAIGDAARTGRLEGAAQWAPGPDRWLGSGELVRRWSDALELRAWEVRLRAGRDVVSLDRDDGSPGLLLVRALLFGGDATHYEGIDGARVAFARETPGWSAGVSARDQLESPLATTATWTLTGQPLLVTRNDPATLARVHEVAAWGVARLPALPLRLQLRAWRGGGGLGGDASYVRGRASLGGALALGRHVTLTTQADYGRLRGEALPQEAFYVGGPTLYTLAPNAIQGAGRALGRAELMLADPLQALLGLDPRPTFPLQIGVFAGTAACWGSDPATGLAQLTARDWPRRSAWLGELGVSILYRPGLPDPDTFLRLTFARATGPDHRPGATYVSFTRALDFLRAR